MPCLAPSPLSIDREAGDDFLLSMAGSGTFFFRGSHVTSVIDSNRARAEKAGGVRLRKETFGDVW